MNTKDTFNVLCEMIANNYINSGWKYSKSNHWVTKKDKKFVYRIYFYTSWNNIRNENVSFYGEAAILPIKLKNKIYYISTQNSHIPNGKLYWNIVDKKDLNSAFIEFTAWLEQYFLPLVKRCSEDLESFIKDVVKEGFCPERGYITDISFILNNGTKMLAEESAQKHYDNLTIDEKIKFKRNYESLINGNGHVDSYGENYMLNYCNFKTIIENKIKIKL
ncbi:MULTISPECIES: hypothetical protein [unclassified Clostridium]|uniref:hypothetical protein n=1 Tax=unclassified Clostridium TaxID=2614128 RepID=UPI002079BB4E|nr:MULTISPECIES: hypothetical protein [unclassified Clostridium]